MANEQADTPLPFRRILVTGADGFVGRHLIPALSARLAEGAVLMFASRAPGDRPDWIALDLTNPGTVATAIAKARPDLLIHLAAQASVGRSVGSAAETWSINLGGSLALARAITESAPNCTVLFASSIEVYGLTFNTECVTERSPLRPQGPYACSKAAAEAMFADVLPIDAQLVVTRAANHSGLGQDERFVIPAFAAQIARIEQGAAPIINVGNLDAQRDFLDVRDVVSAYVTLLANAASLPKRSLFNIATGRTVRIGDILARLRALGRSRTTVMPDPQRMRPSEVPQTRIDSGAIRATTGWVPAHTLDEMLAEVLEGQRLNARDGLG